MDIDFVIRFIEKVLADSDRDCHRHILEGSGLFYAGVDMALSTVLVLLRSIKSQSKNCKSQTQSQK